MGKTMNLTEEQQIELRSTIASLYYLSKEAEIAGLENVSKVIMSTIDDLDKTMKIDKIDLSGLIVKNDLLPLLDFMYKYTNEEKFEIIAEVVKTKEEQKLDVGQNVHTIN